MRCLMSSVALALAGCATAPVPMAPPPDLVAPCPEPAARASTNGELAAYALELKIALRGCNRQLEALREWARD